MNTQTSLNSNGKNQSEYLQKGTKIPPLWILPYLGSILVSSVSGSGMYGISGINIEHLFLGAALWIVSSLFLSSSGFRSLVGLNRLILYLLLYCLALSFGFLSSLRQGPSLVGSATLFYWCGLIISIGLGALAAFCNRVLLLGTISFSGLAILVSVLIPILPFPSIIMPSKIVNDWYMGRATGVFFNPNWTGFALYIAFSSCLSLYCFVQRCLTRLGCLILAAFYAFGIILTLSRASILVMLLTAGFFIYNRRQEIKKHWLIFCAIFFILFIGLRQIVYKSDFSQITQARLFDTELYEEDTFRIRGLINAWKNLSYLFILGEGTDQFQKLSYKYIGSYDKSAHNQILVLWVEWGFFALLSMYSAHLWVIGEYLRARHHHRFEGMDMLMCIYVCILIFLQTHNIYSPSSCALIGLFTGSVFQAPCMVLKEKHLKNFVKTVPG